MDDVARRVLCARGWSAVSAGGGRAPGGDPKGLWRDSLPLPLLGLESIATILCNTRFRKTSTATLRETWDLASDESLAQASALLFEKSCGHPRMLAQLMRECRTYADVCGAKGKYATHVKNWAELYRALWSWRSLLREWLPSFAAIHQRGSGSYDLQSCPTVNLMATTVQDEDGNQLAVETVLAQCHIH